jgi:Mrp family chromosome partitioning ATPase
MSNIYEALEHARREIRAVEPCPDEPIHVEQPDLSVCDGPGPDMEDEMITLYQTITASLPGIEHRSVLFMGSRSNEGTSTVARQLARTVSLRIEKSVLLIDLDRSRPDLHVYANLKQEKNVDEIVECNGEIEEALCQVEESNLYVMPLFQGVAMTPRTLEFARGGRFWEPLRKRFDLIIVDSPPATIFPEGPGIVSMVDGVVLVVEAEKTRWPVALSVKKKIEQSGGRILGIVFNKRKYYIPNWLYKRI